MARSSYIYLVRDEYTCRIIGAFTVKHEALTAMSQIQGRGRRLFRLPDGQRSIGAAWVEVNEPEPT